MNTMNDTVRFIVEAMVFCKRNWNRLIEAIGIELAEKVVYHSTIAIQSYFGYTNICSRRLKLYI